MRCTLGSSSVMLEPRGFFSSGMLAVIRLWELNHTWRTGCLENNPEHAVRSHPHWTPKIRALGKERLWIKHGVVETSALPTAGGWEPAPLALPAWSRSHIFYPHLVGSSQNTRGGQKIRWKAGREGWMRAGLAAGCPKDCSAPRKGRMLPKTEEKDAPHTHALGWLRNAP